MSVMRPVITPSLVSEKSIPVQSVTEATCTASAPPAAGEPRVIIEVVVAVAGGNYPVTARVEGGERVVAIRVRPGIIAWVIGLIVVRAIAEGIDISARYRISLRVCDPACDGAGVVQR